MLIKHLKSRIDSIFQGESEIIKEYSKRGYWVPNEVCEKSIFFMGLNPSYPHKNYEVTDRIFYDISEQDDHYFRQLKKLYEDISEKDNNKGWTHLDLLMIRETKQSEVKKLLKSQVGKEFIIENIKISKDILEKSNPKIVVVLNTLTRDLINKTLLGEFGYNFKWDKNIGTYRFGEETTLYGTPVFFSGMLSGQRALDKGSRERLAWHINYVLKYESGKFGKLKVQ